MRHLPIPLALLAIAASSQAQTIYVDAQLSTGAGDGTTWANAFQGENGLQAALSSGQTFTEVYVTGGRYETTASNVRGISFDLSGAVQVFGGFAGGEAAPEERPPFGSNPSVLTGDLLDDDDPSDGSTRVDNAYHVVRVGGAGTASVLDGFTIQGGNADGLANFRHSGGGVFVEDDATLTVRNCRFERHHARRSGGGAFCFVGTLNLEDCVFTECNARERGGAVCGANATELRIERCIVKECIAPSGAGLATAGVENTEVRNSAFFDNVATGAGGGGGMYLSSSGRVHITGCTIAANTATGITLQARAGVVVAGSWVTVRNSILWGNEGNAGSTTSQHQLTSGVDTEYCIVDGGYIGVGCTDADPLFLDYVGRDLRLSPWSTALDAGDPSAIRSPVRADLEQRRREVDDPTVPNTGPGLAPHPDLGAFERSSLVGTVLCTANSGSLGRAAILDASGSTVVTDQDLTLTARLLPSATSALFLASRASGFVANPAGSLGNLCLGGAIGRFVGAGQIQFTGPMGIAELGVPLDALPTPLGLVQAVPGDSWFFQTWFRESVTGIPTSNFTDAVRIQFE